MGSEKTTAWWNQEVKEVIRIKKTAFRAWLTNSWLSEQLCLRYSAARKTAATIVKQSKEKPWKEFGQKLNTEYRSANKVFWQTIHRLRDKQAPVAAFVEDTNIVFLKHQKGVLNCWREYFCELLNPVTVQHLGTSEEQIGEEIHPTEVEVSTAIKPLKAGKGPDEDDICPEMLKAMNNFEVRWLTCVCLVENW